MDIRWCVHCDKKDARIAELEAQLLEAELTTGEALNQLDDAEATAARIAELEAQFKWQEEAHQLALRKAGAEMEALQEKNAELEGQLAHKTMILDHLYEVGVIK
jgi:hypothetical protein